MYLIKQKPDYSCGKNSFLGFENQNKSVFLAKFLLRKALTKVVDLMIASTSNNYPEVECVNEVSICGAAIQLKIILSKGIVSELNWKNNFEILEKTYWR